MKPIRQFSPRETYFVTFSTWQRRELFVVEAYVRLFLKILYGYKREGRFRLHAFVLMPEHIHLLLTPAPSITLERALQLIKGGYSHAFGIAFRNGEVWQPGFTDHRIRDAEDFAHHREYIQRNPVERHLVERPTDYRYSSAFPGFRLDPWPQRLKPRLLKRWFGTSKLVPFPTEVALFSQIFGAREWHDFSRAAPRWKGWL